MAVNSYRKDETTITAGKAATLARLFSYLLAYKKQIAGVLLIMAFCVFVNLVNPLIMESAVDVYKRQAFNNLSDAGSSLITLVGFKMAGQERCV